MEKDSLTISAAEKETPSRNALRLRALNDIDRLNAVAGYHGYYACRLNPIVTDSPTLNVDFAISLGERFSFGTMTIDWNDEDLVRDDLLKQGLARAIKRGGTILIPAFSLERTQLMLYELSNFFDAGDLPKVPVFLDSPLAIHVTAVYEKWGMTYFKKETEAEMKREGSIFSFPFLKMTSSRDQSEEIDKAPSPKIIIAGAGIFPPPSPSQQATRERSAAV